MPSLLKHANTMTAVATPQKEASTPSKNKPKKKATQPFAGPDSTQKSAQQTATGTPSPDIKAHPVCFTSFHKEPNMYRITDWTGRICFNGKTFETIEEADDYITEQLHKLHPTLTDEQFDEIRGEFYPTFTYAEPLV